MAEPSPRACLPIVLTGASGWIGTAMLARTAAERGPAWANGVSLFGSAAGVITTADGSVLPVRPLATIGAADVAGAIVIHLAYLTKEKAALLGAERFDATNQAIDAQLLAALHGARPHALFVASSGAAALAQDGRDPHPYGLAKLAQEARFLRWADETGIPMIAGRIFNVAGPYINKRDSYAISDFITQARATGTIRIDATMPVFRSYLHVDNLCALVLAAAARGLARDRPIDLCGAEIVEMADIAAAVAETVGGDVNIIRQPLSFDRFSAYLGDFIDTKLLSIEVGLSLTNFLTQVADTASWLEAVRN